MKGGVAKTTTSVMLAEGFAEFCSFKILIADCDPQFNATRMLVGSRQIEQIFASPINKAKTIARYLQNSVSQATFPRPAEYVTKSVGTVFGKGCVDLLAGSPRILDVDQSMMMTAAAPGRTIELVLERASTAVVNLNEAGPYDLAIVDCPAAPSMTVRAFLKAADLLLVPTTADDTALAGLGTLDFNLRNLDDDNIGLIRSRRVLVTRYKNFSQRNLEALKGQQLLTNTVSESTRIRDARLFSSAAGDTFSQKYGKTAEKEYKRIVNQLATILGISIAPTSQPSGLWPKDILSVKRFGNGGGLSSGTPTDRERETSTSDQIGKSN